MLVSIIIPTYNNAAKLYSCLIALLESVKMIGNEVIVVDDCSTDNTFDVVSEFPVRYLRLKDRSGPYVCRNEGVSLARYDHILFLDSGCIVALNTVRALLATLEIEDAEVVLPEVIFNFSDEFVFSEYVDVLIYGNGKELITRKTNFSARCFLCKKKLLSELGYFAPLRSGGDLLWSSKCFSSGKKVCLAEFAYVYFQPVSPNQLWRKAKRFGMAKRHPEIRNLWGKFDLNSILRQFLPPNPLSFQKRVQEKCWKLSVKQKFKVYFGFWGFKVARAFYAFLS